jgi:hypothetical protein
MSGFQIVSIEKNEWVLLVIVRWNPSASKHFNPRSTMKLSAFVFSLFLASASAEKEINLVRGSISTQSDVGKLLLSKARQLDQNNNNNY